MRHYYVLLILLVIIPISYAAIDCTSGCTAGQICGTGAKVLIQGVHFMTQDASCGSSGPTLATSNVIWDCRGNDLSGNGAFFMSVNVTAGLNNVTVQNCNITGHPVNGNCIETLSPVTLINTTLSVCNTEIAGASSINFSNWLTVEVNDSLGNPISGAQVQAINAGEYDFNTVTDAQGVARLAVVNETFNPSTTVNPYTINATNSSHKDEINKNINNQSEVELTFNIVAVDNPPTVNLLAPNGATLPTHLNFSFNANDDNNLTTCILYGNFSGTWEKNETLLVNKPAINGNITIDPNPGNYIWNVNCTDNNTQSAFASTNYSVTITSQTYINVTRLKPNTGTYKYAKNFSYGVNISCTGDCGTVTAILDPIEVKQELSIWQKIRNWFRGITGFFAGDIVPMNSGPLFYTIDQNPTSAGCLVNMVDSDCLVYWDVYINGTKGTYQFFANASSTNGYKNQTDNIDITIAYNIPTVNLAKINSSSNTTADNIKCIANITGFGTLSANATMYQNGNVFSKNQVATLNNSGVIAATVPAVNINEGDVWTCGIQGFDDLNYTAEVNSSLTIKSTSNCDITLSSTNVAYPTQVNVSCNCSNPQATAKLYEDGLLIPNNQFVTRGAGNYSFQCNVTSTADYSNATINGSLEVDRASSTCTLTQSHTAVTVGINTNASCSCTNPESLSSLYRDNVFSNFENNTKVNLDVNNYTYECNTSKSENYTGDSQTGFLNITKDTLGLNLLMNGNGGNVQTTNKEITFNASSDPNVTVNLYNGTNLLNAGMSPFDVKLNFSKGTYTIELNGTGDENHTDNSVTRTLTINTQTTGGGSGGGGDPPVIIVEPPIEPPVDEPPEDPDEPEDPDDDTDDTDETDGTGEPDPRDIIEQIIECDSQECVEEYQEVLQQFEETLQQVEIITDMKYDAERDVTIINITVIPNDDMKDFEYYQSIPKCMAAYVELIHHWNNPDFEVIERDPLIVWQFDQVKKGQPIDLSFEVLGKVEPGCYELLDEVIVGDLYEQPAPPKISGIILGIAAVLAVILLGSVGYQYAGGVKNIGSFSDFLHKKRVSKIKDRMKKLP